MTITRVETESELEAQGFRMAGRVERCKVCTSRLQPFFLAGAKIFFRIESKKYEGSNRYQRHTADDCRDLVRRKKR